MNRTIELSSDVYPIGVLKQCVSDYRSFCSVDWGNGEPGNLRLTITPNADSGHPQDLLSAEFLNYLLDSSIRAFFEAEEGVATA